MTRPSRLPLWLGLTAWVVGAGAAAAAAPADPPPNVVLIVVDDLGHADLGCTGSSFYETPNLDRLAARGVRFTQAYAACPVCSPTRAGLMTGKVPQRVGITDYIGAAQPGRWDRNTRLLPAPYREELALGETTVAEAFRAGGYATGFVGKWHLGGQGFAPTDQGFEFNRGGGPQGAAPHRPPYRLPTLPDGPPGEYLADRLTDEALKFVDAHKDRPFFLELAHYDVHTPLVGKDELVKKYRARSAALGTTEADRWRPEPPRQDRRVQDHAVYAAMMEALDADVGRLLDRIEALGLTGRTVVVFTSDNGGLSTSEGSPTSNGPLRAGKGWLYEGGIRVPLLVAGAGVTRAGAAVDTPVISTDLYPTLLALAGLPPRPEQHRDGRTLVPLLTGQPDPAADRPLFWHYPHYGNQGGAPGAAVRRGDWKLIRWYEGNRPELFNLKDDPGERTNLAAREPARVAALARELSAWLTDTGAVMPTPNPRFRPDGPDGRAPGGGQPPAARKKAG